MDNIIDPSMPATDLGTIGAPDRNGNANWARNFNGGVNYITLPI